MKAKVDQNLCIGCGACVSMCPETFEFGKDHKSHAKGECKNCDCKAVAAACPVGAITVEE
ncbi:MAG: ferredoxin [Candidatus Diapherotrites archaeon]|nr:ferredoxin [Candidatus Diapherotrites archaeon]